MIYVALAAIGALAIGLSAFAGALRWMIRQHARERELLLNQVLHAAGRTWSPPPADRWEPEPAPPQFTAAPEQFVGVE